MTSNTRLFALAITGILSLAYFVSTAQTPKNFFTLAAKGGYGISYMMDKNIFGNADVKPNFAPSSYFYGGKLGFYFTESAAIQGEVLLNTFGQEFKVTTPLTSDPTSDLVYTRLIEMTAMEFPLLFRYTSEDARIYEIGLKYATLKTANQTTTVTSDNYDNAVADGDVLPYFNSSYISAVAGLGNAFVRAEKFDLSWSLRFNYALGNILKDQSYPFHDVLYTPGNPQATMSPLSVTVGLEFQWYLGYFSKSSCGKSVKFLLF